MTDYFYQRQIRIFDYPKWAEPLREALELAQRCDAAPLARRAREELLATGAHPRRERMSGPDALTPSERRVAEMAAGGLTNREIAEALFVTAKTVGTHLGHIYRKLDLDGPHAREQLSERLGRDAARAVWRPGPAGRHRCAAGRRGCDACAAPRRVRCRGAAARSNKVPGRRHSPPSERCRRRRP